MRAACLQPSSFSKTLFLGGKREQNRQLSLSTLRILTMENSNFCRTGLYLAKNLKSFCFQFFCQKCPWKALANLPICQADSVQLSQKGTKLFFYIGYLKRQLLCCKFCEKYVSHASQRIAIRRQYHASLAGGQRRNVLQEMQKWRNQQAVLGTQERLYLVVHRKDQHTSLFPGIFRTH